MTVTHDRPASPEQPHDGFDEGQERLPDTPEDEREGRFSTGQEELPHRPHEHKGRFSEGEQERLPDTPEKDVERRFSEGQEHTPPGR
ncbi:MAG TPA: hypothetical protein VHJ34_01815 [Actinomycetota bacterium]|nr:hypothetical protein [Actinomycetota bacterium]